MRAKRIFQEGKVFLASLLVAGTAIGAGMLGLPIATAEAGILASWSMYALVWLFNVCTGILFLEVAQWLPENANIGSMAERFLGRWGKNSVWILYLFLFYTLTVAYIAGGGLFIRDVFGSGMSHWVSNSLFTLIFGGIVYGGTTLSGRVNFLLMIGLVASYFLFVGWGFEAVHAQHALWSGWESAIWGLPILFTSFGFQSTVPTLFTYLDRNVKRARSAIIVGATLPFIAYIFWDLWIKSIVPVTGPHSLLSAKAAGQNALSPLAQLLPNSPITLIGQFFAFFALVTSFIGVTLGLVDFLGDSLKLRQGKSKRFNLCMLAFVPPLLITFFKPDIFLKALGYAGGFGVAILLGILPIFLVWLGRYRDRCEPRRPLLGGGKVTLYVLLFFVFFELCIELFQQV